MQYLMLIIAACLLSSCARVMMNPRTGETVTCRENLLNPWSQGEACVGNHIAQGWRELRRGEATDGPAAYEYIQRTEPK